MENESKNKYDITDNPNFPKLLKILACPKCKGTIEFQKDDRRWLCPECLRLYFIENGVPNFLIDESVILVKSPETGKILDFDHNQGNYINADGESFDLKEIEKILGLKLQCIEEDCQGKLIFNKEKLSYLCDTCTVEYPIPNGITNCLLENCYT